MITKIYPSGENLPEIKFSPDMLQRERLKQRSGFPVKKDKKLQKLIELCFEMQLCVRVNPKDGRINIYEDMGEWECAEQALLYLNKLIEGQKT